MTMRKHKVPQIDTKYPLRQNMTTNRHKVTQRGTQWLYKETTSTQRDPISRKKHKIPPIKQKIQSNTLYLYSTFKTNRVVQSAVHQYIFKKAG